MLLFLLSLRDSSGVTSNSPPPARKYSGPLLQNNIGVSRTFYWWGLRTEASYLHRAHIETPKASGRKGIGRGAPSPADYEVWGSVVSSPEGGPGLSPGDAIACRPSIRPSVTLVDLEHTG